MGTAPSFHVRFGQGAGDRRGRARARLAALSCVLSVITFLRLLLHWSLAFCIVMGLVGAVVALLVSEFQAARARRRNYQSGRWSRVELALGYDVSFGGASARLDALALAGVGDFDSARRLLLRPDSCQDEERELSLCTRVVIASFEGQREHSLLLCRQLVDLPLEPAWGHRQRRTARRAGVVALARALAGAADEVDYAELRLTASLEPALFWPCRYGVALACCAQDESELACSILSGAPSWPKESIFHSLHAKIVERAGSDQDQSSGALVANI